LNAYETVIIIDPSLDEAGVDKLIDKYAQLVKDRQGEIAQIEKWGRRKMAYPINNRQEGFYVCLQYHAASSVPAELNRSLRLDETVIRHLTLKGHVQSPTAAVPEAQAQPQTEGQPVPASA
jgi:small subunit ribosomal protein S6